MYYTEYETVILDGFLSEFFVNGSVNPQVSDHFRSILERISQKILSASDLRNICEALELILQNVQLNHESYREVLGLIAKTRQMMQR